MLILASFLIGFSITFLTTLLPGLVNMNVAKISLKQGKSKALAFAGGASITVFIQAILATQFARFIDKRTDISNTIQEVGIFIFIILSAYFLFFAKHKKIDQNKIQIHRKRSNFFNGIFLSAINLFPIPFYVILSVTLYSYGYFSFEKSFIILFSLGSATSAMFVFYLYAIYIKQFESRTDFILKNINKLIGYITLIVAIIGIIKRLQ